MDKRGFNTTSERAWFWCKLGKRVRRAEAVLFAPITPSRAVRRASASHRLKRLLHRLQLWLASA
eukprot:6208188-Pleurochrysis_carterae.AAC.2